MQSWLNANVELELQTRATASYLLMRPVRICCSCPTSFCEPEINNANQHVTPCFDAHDQAYQLEQYCPFSTWLKTSSLPAIPLLSIRYLIKDFKHVQVAVGKELVPSVITGHGHRDALATQLMQQGHPPPSGGTPPLLIPILHIQTGSPKCHQHIWSGLIRPLGQVFPYTSCCFGNRYTCGEAYYVFSDQGTSHVTTACAMLHGLLSPSKCCVTDDT